MRERGGEKQWRWDGTSAIPLGMRDRRGSLTPSDPLRSIESLGDEEGLEKNMTGICPAPLALGTEGIYVYL